MSIVIPTRQREKLPEGYTYPLWPTKLTDAFEGTDQRNDAELVFHLRDDIWESRWKRRLRNRSKLALVSVTYTPSWSPYYPKWKISCFSVPNDELEMTRRLLVDHALPALAELISHYDLTPEQPVCETVLMNIAEGTFEIHSKTPEELARMTDDVRLQRKNTAA